MEKLTITIDRQQVSVDRSTSIHEFLQKFDCNSEKPVMLARLNHKYYELTSALTESGILEPVSINDNAGLRTYIRTLQFILIKAVYDIFPRARVTIEHSLGRGIFGEIHKEAALNSQDISRIKYRMKEIINEDIQIHKVTISRLEAVKIFEGYGMKDKIDIFSSMDEEKVELYELQGRYDYFFGFLAWSTGDIKLFDLVLHDSGFLLRYPVSPDYSRLPELMENRKLDKIFMESEQWAKILDVCHLGSLNRKVTGGEISDIVKISEALHEKKIANIADMISHSRNAKLVLIAGPSSSGKTTFSKRLGIQLRVNGLIPVPISLDNYFLDREQTPKDENGSYDFEALEAIDLMLFNENLEALLSGEEIRVPDFDFLTGKRVWKGMKLNLPENGVVIVEGIHGLNHKLTKTIPEENKFKIYISALTNLNLDDHNRIATTDVRIMRRIVRDHLFRGYTGEETLAMWPSIRRGEEKNIFVYQENADTMFNSTLVYELCILKKQVMALLEEIGVDSPVFNEAERLKKYLSHVKEAPELLVPDNSILREFIGGSSF